MDIHEIAPRLKAPALRAPPSKAPAALKGPAFNLAGLALRSSHGPRPPFKLIGALRGGGHLLAPQGGIPVDYQIDAFAAGGVRTATGGLTGDFSAWPEVLAASEAATLDGQLRLSSGVVLTITIIGREDGQLEFDLPCNAALLGQINQRRRN